MLLDGDRRGIPYHWDQGSGEEPQWRQVLRESEAVETAYSVLLHTTRPRCVREGCGSDQAQLHECLMLCAQEIEDLSWRRTMELCCKHLDLVEVRAVSQRLPCTVSACAFISPITHEHRIDTAGV